MGMFDNLLSGFPFESRADMEKKERDFEKRVLPFGLPQREAAAKLLAQLLPGVKQETERLYVFLGGKDEYTKAADPADGLLDAARLLPKLAKWCTGEALALVLALVVLDANVPDLEHYPGEEDVRQKAAQLAGSLP